jgi:thiosulfate dehydrogenase
MLRLRSGAALAALAVALVLSGCSGRASSNGVYDPNNLPKGGLGDEIRLGREAITNTMTVMPHNIRARMNCSACHIDGGARNDKSGSFVGTYARFPQYGKRAHRVITLQDRIAECFLYSENGTPPAYTSREMIGMVAYIAYLSRNVPTGTRMPERQDFVVELPKNDPPNINRGAKIFAQRCAMCHQPNGAGIPGVYPPLWGPKSFNNGAGMAHLNRIVGFVKNNMPANAPGTLSFNEAYDVGAFVLSHSRPKFQGSRVITQPSHEARFF